MAEKNGGRRVATLNESGHLVGTAKLAADAALPEGAVDMDPGDLPLDGTYKWQPDRRCFLPLGSGLPRVERAPVSEEHVLYKLAKGSADPDVVAWVGWYERNLQQRNEELSLRHRRRRR